MDMFFAQYFIVIDKSRSISAPQFFGHIMHRRNRSTSLIYNISFILLTPFVTPFSTYNESNHHNSPRRHFRYRIRQLLLYKLLNGISRRFEPSPINRSDMFVEVSRRYFCLEHLVKLHI